MAVRASFRRCAVPLAMVMLIAAGCGDDDEGSTTTTTAPDTTQTTLAVPDGIEIGAGMNDPEDATIAVLQFMPAQVTVEANAPVTWVWTGAEPHSVTFLEPGQVLPPPGSDDSLFEPTPPTGAYDGTTFVNTGLQPLGPTSAEPFELTFSKAGSYAYYCVIHPQMVGEVEVVEAGGEVDTPAGVAQRRSAEAGEWLAEGRAAKAALVNAEPGQVENPDGTTTWTVEMGAATEHTDILAFAPTPADARAGDTVTFVNNSTAPHTATFFGEGAEIIQSPLDPRAAEPAPGPSPQALSSSGLFNTGLLPPDAPPGAGPPVEARSFSFTVADPGSYAYVCLF
ncbi:MAG: cupredoxin domain-containing protein, partial [Acidimicrobiales bacterium]